VDLFGGALVPVDRAFEQERGLGVGAHRVEPLEMVLGEHAGRGRLPPLCRDARTGHQHNRENGRRVAMTMGSAMGACDRKPGAATRAPRNLTAGKALGEFADSQIERFAELRTAGVTVRRNFVIVHTILPISHAPLLDIQVKRSP
jgi:hypothetical protein